MSMTQEEIDAFRAYIETLVEPDQKTEEDV
jgi:hypothetical protein